MEEGCGLRAIPQPHHQSTSAPQQTRRPPTDGIITAPDAVAESRPRTPRGISQFDVLAQLRKISSGAVLTAAYPCLYRATSGRKTQLSGFRIADEKEEDHS